MANNAQELDHVLPDRQILRELAELEDPVGVLSIYVTADPREEKSTKPAWAIRVGNQMTALREELAADPDRARAKRALRALDDHRDEIRRVLRGREHGRGRALFAPLGDGGTPRLLSVQLSLPDLVLLQAKPYLRPLLEAHEQGAPAGVAVVHRTGARIIDIRYGYATELESEGFDLDTDDWREKRGPASPILDQRSGTQREKYAQRLEQRVERLLAQVAARFEKLAPVQGWEHLVVTGESRVAEAFRAALCSSPVLLVTDDLARASAFEVAEAVRPHVAQVRQREAARAAEAAKDAALAGGHGAVGLPDTLSALRSGAVGTLLLDRTRDWEGARSTDGRLYPLTETPSEISDLIPEQRMGEQMIEAALRSKSEITMLDGDAVRSIAAYDGVAAQLRW